MADPRFFNREGPFTLDVIVNLAGASIHGNHDGSRLFWDVAGLENAEAGDLGFLDNSKYVEVFERSRAGACFVNTKFRDRAPDGMIPIVCEDPYLAFALAARMFYPEPAAIPGISDKALVDPGAHVGEDASIGAFAVISAGVEIGARCSIGAGAVLCDNVRMGDDCHIGPGATLMFCVIGNRAWIDAGARVGTQGFGFARSPKGAVRIPHVGRVLIGDDVEIGANTTIDRGSISDTVIESGTMIDNQVQIAHNVKIGRYAILAAQAGLAGSAVIGEFAMLGGRTSVANHVRVGRGARMGGCSSAAGDLAEGQTYLGTPAVPTREFWRHHAIIRRLSRRDSTS